MTIGDLRPLLDAIYAKESTSGADRRDGDGGRSRGPYQIGLKCWLDSDMGLPYEPFVRNKMVAEIAIYGYALRWEPAALARLDFQVLARLHNGGPDWRDKPSTLDYWADIRWRLNRQGGRRESSGP